MSNAKIKDLTSMAWEAQEALEPFKEYSYGLAYLRRDKIKDLCETLQSDIADALELPKADAERLFQETHDYLNPVTPEPYTYDFLEFVRVFNLIYRGYVIARS